MQNKRCILAAILMVQALALETARAIELANPSFEILEPTTGSYPSAVGDWSGNLSAIVPAENGIMPLAGNRMLKFLATGLLPTGGGDSIGSTVVQSRGGLKSTGRHAI
jgi:hypothetical protein